MGFSTQMLVNMGDFLFLKDQDLPATSVYQAFSDDLIARAALSPPLLRGTEQLQAGVLEAPLGDVTIVFSSVVGAATLLAWNHALASQALETFEVRFCLGCSPVAQYVDDGALQGACMWGRSTCTIG